MVGAGVGLVKSTTCIFYVRVHPKYKTKYRVSNWSDYDLAIVQRGDIKHRSREE